MKRELVVDASRDEVDKSFLDSGWIPIERILRLFDSKEGIKKKVSREKEVMKCVPV